MKESPETPARREPVPEAANRQPAPPFPDARELRRAMLMAEVLGAPRSLRPL